MPLVDVIVLNYNGKHFLGPCLEALSGQTFQDFETLVVDNGSSDGSVDFLREQYPDVKVLALPKNYGFAGGNNRGIEATTSKYVALLNNDTEVSPEWLHALVDVLELKPEVGSCASKMIQISDRFTVDTVGDLYYAYGGAEKRGFGEPADLYDEPSMVFGACAGAAIYRREMLDDIGLLDEDFFVYYEDVDLSFRAQLRGYRCQYVPAAVVYHHVSGFFAKHLGEKGRLSRRNMLEVLVKNMPVSLLIKNSLWIMLVLIYFDVYHMLHGDAKMILSARWDNVRRFRRTLEKRKYIQCRKTISAHALESLFSPGGFVKFRKKMRRLMLS